MFSPSLHVFVPLCAKLSSQALATVNFLDTCQPRRRLPMYPYKSAICGLVGQFAAKVLVTTSPVSTKNCKVRISLSTCCAVT